MQKALNRLIIITALFCPLLAGCGKRQTEEKVTAMPPLEEDSVENPGENWCVQLSPDMSPCLVEMECLEPDSPWDAPDGVAYEIRIYPGENDTEAAETIPVTMYHIESPTLVFKDINSDGYLDMVVECGQQAETGAPLCDIYFGSREYFSADDHADGFSDSSFQLYGDTGSPVPPL